jgi:hypothetical protein
MIGGFPLVLWGNWHRVLRVGNLSGRARSVSCYSVAGAGTGGAASARRCSRVVPLRGRALPASGRSLADEGHQGVECAGLLLNAFSERLVNTNKGRRRRQRVSAGSFRRQRPASSGAGGPLSRLVGALPAASFCACMGVGVWGAPRLGWPGRSQGEAHALGWQTPGWHS